jgi:hypothetical protein
LEIYSSSKLDELRFEKKKFDLLPLENDETRLSALKESEICVYDDGNVLGLEQYLRHRLELFLFVLAQEEGVLEKTS